MNSKNIARSVDISAVKTTSTKADVDQIIEAAKAFDFICVFPNPAFLEYTIDQLKDREDILVGGVCGFPSGSELTSTKVFQAKEHKALGCDEVDMVMNLGWLKSGELDKVANDIKEVHEAVYPLPLKVIIETPLLTEEEIKVAAKIVADSPATFVKTGTGWSGATTFRHVELMKEVIEDKVQIKVAGGVRDYETLKTFSDLGVTRFGIGRDSAIQIMESIKETEAKAL